MGATMDNADGRAIEPKKGRCVACKREGNRTDDFICMDCGDPEKSMLVCQCGRRADVARLDTRKEKFFLQNFFKGIDPEIWSLPDVRQKGITILVPVCGKCVGGKEDGPLEKTEVYRIRDPF